MNRYKALEDLGVKPEDCYMNWQVEGETEDNRYEEWKKQREEYGIDERATWNWSEDFMDYMYIHLEMFNRVNIVDFTAENITFENKEMTVQQAIDEILNWMETVYYPKKDDFIDINDYKDRHDEYIKEIEKWVKERKRIQRLFAEIIDHLNW